MRYCIITQQSGERTQEKTIGYARTASSEQDVSAQVEALKEAGCTEIFTDMGVSGNTLDRPGLQKAKAGPKRGDTLMVVRTDRLARAAPAYYRFLRDLLRDGIEFKSIFNHDEAQADMLRVNYGPALPPDATYREILTYKAARFLLWLGNHESRLR